MPIENFEEGYDYFVYRLRKMEKIKVPDNFETEVFEKIKSYRKNDREKQEDKENSSGRVIPFVAIAFISAAFIFLFDAESAKTNDSLYLKQMPTENSVKYFQHASLPDFQSSGAKIYSDSPKTGSSPFHGSNSGQNGENLQKRQQNGGK